MSLCSHAQVCDYPALQHSVVCRQNNNNNRNNNNKIMINKNENYKVTFHLFISLCGVFIVPQQYDLFEAMHLK